MKNSNDTIWIEPATFRFVAQHLNHCPTAIPRRRTVRHKITHVMEKPPASIFRVEVEGNSFPPKRRQISKRLHGVMSKKRVTTNRTSNLAKQIRICAVYVNTALKLGGWETYISTQSQGRTNTVSSHWICWRGKMYKATVHKAITWSGQTREKGTWGCCILIA